MTGVKQLKVTFARKAEVIGIPVIRQLTADGEVLLWPQLNFIHLIEDSSTTKIKKILALPKESRHILTILSSKLKYPF